MLPQAVATLSLQLRWVAALMQVFVSISLHVCLVTKLIVELTNT